METHYQNLVTAELKILSDFIDSELEKNSPRSLWKHMDNIKEQSHKYLRVHDEVRKERSEGIDFSLLQLHSWEGYTCFEWEETIYEMMRKTQHNPFIPSKIRNAVSSYYLNRLNKMTKIKFEEFDKFKKELLEEEKLNGEEKWEATIFNRILVRYRNAGIGFEDVKKRINEFREIIYEYLQETNVSII